MESNKIAAPSHLTLVCQWVLTEIIDVCCCYCCYAECFFIYCYSECHYAECRYAECLYAELRGANRNALTTKVNLENPVRI